MYHRGLKVSFWKHWNSLLLQSWLIKKHSAFQRVSAHFPTRGAFFCLSFFLKYRFGLLAPSHESQYQSQIRSILETVTIRVKQLLISLYQFNAGDTVGKVLNSALCLFSIMADVLVVINTSHRQHRCFNGGCAGFQTLHHWRPVRHVSCKCVKKNKVPLVL